MTESEQIKPGDIVQLKSEDYNFMTVANIYQRVATCVFFDKDGHFKSIEVQTVVLKKREFE